MISHLNFETEKLKLNNGQEERIWIGYGYLPVANSRKVYILMRKI